jgi:hypothetical protein
MTRNQYVKSLEAEIKKLNRRIDQKIMRGENYFFESIRHKFLLKQLQKHESEGLLTKLFPSFF